MTKETPRYHRILLKLSGEALLGEDPSGVSAGALKNIATSLQQLVQAGVQVGLVVGGGNFLRGQTLAKAGVDRVSADHMGMLATVMNALALHDTLQKHQVASTILSAIAMPSICATFERSQAIAALHTNQVVIFAGGTGNPLFTTDSAACLRGIEIDADLIIKATKVDGVYSEDPLRNPNATRYTTLTYQEALDRRLEVMDLAAFCLARDHDKTLCVINMNKPDALWRAVCSAKEGTVITN